MVGMGKRIVIGCERGGGSEKVETQSVTDRFVKTRIPRYLTFFETALKTNNGGNG